MRNLEPKTKEKRWFETNRTSSIDPQEIPRVARMLPKTDHRAGGDMAYIPPIRPQKCSLQDLVRKAGRKIVGQKQFDLLRETGSKDAWVYAAGDLALLQNPAVSIVGTREVSDDGYRRAHRLARELVSEGVIVMSGLARGVDEAAHTGAIAHGGRTIAVIGTPLDKAYPAEHAELQMEIYRDHLLLSPFSQGEKVFRSNFPKRNRVMALLSDATVIVEASDTSGTLHQAAECLRQERWLFIMRSVAEDPSLSWPAKFLDKPRVRVLKDTSEILQAIQ
jgi:DNA protecting protein DprA